MNPDSIKASLDNLQSQLECATANPKPNYTIDGKTVSWADYLKGLVEGIDLLNGLYLKALGGVEVRSCVI